MTIARSRAEFDRWRAGVDEVAVVLTMGALHEGHASLIRVAKESGLPVVLTVFVNPTQFAPGEDLDRYPRTEEADLALARTLDVECIWLPGVEEIYPPHESVERIEPGPLGGVLEGAVRPGHFTGVLTVVNRFFQIIKPTIAVFGKKDRQQLALIAQMVRERSLPVTIVAGETVREPDGLARSSRNRYLTAGERERAAIIPAALTAAASSRGGVESILAVARQALDGIDTDYLVITDRELNEVTEDFTGPAIILVAARLGATRLIDNMDVQVQR